MKPYHKRFTRFDRRTLVITKELRRGWSISTNQQKWAKMNRWLEDATRIYKAPAVSLYVGDGDYYRPGRARIVMIKPSIITLLHEFRHHLQHTVAPEGTLMSDIEDDARAWSLSLYHQIAPRTLRRLAEQNKVFHLTPDMKNRQTPEISS